MASFMNYFAGRRDTKLSTRDAIVALRQQLQMIDKKQVHMENKILEERNKAKANVVSNKMVATAALKRMKATELALEQLHNQRFQLEMQCETLESASFNVETVAVMQKGANALKDIHGKMTVDKVDNILADIQDNMQVANELSEALSNTGLSGVDIDVHDLKNELAELEQEELNERLAGAEHVPVHHPAGPSIVESPRQRTAEEDEEADLRQLQAELAM